MKGMSAALDLLHQISREFDIDIASMRNRSRLSHFVEARRQFCIRGRMLKIRVQSLADVLGRDHTVISYHSSPKMQARKRETRKPWGESDRLRKAQRRQDRIAKHQAILEGYQANEKIDYLAAEFNIDPATIRRIVQRARIPMRSPYRPSQGG